MTTEAASAPLASLPLSDKEHEDFLEFLSDNTESGESSCPSSPDDENSAADNNLESLLTLDNVGVDLLDDLLVSPRANLQKMPMQQSWTQPMNHPFNVPFPMLVPLAPQPIATPLVIPPSSFPVNKSTAAIPTAIPTAVPLILPSALHVQRYTQNSQKPQKPGNMAEDRKRKREERLAKNRESANKSRIRRKQNLETLNSEVLALQQQLQKTTAQLIASQAENASLKEQNTFLRSLVTPVTAPATETTQPLANPEVQSFVATSSDKTGTSMGATPARSGGALMFAVVLSCTLLSNPFDYGSGMGQDGSSHASASGRVLLSTLDPITSSLPPALDPITSSMPHLYIPHLQMPHAVPVFYQRILESVVINMLTFTCIAAILLCGTFRRSNLTTILPVFCSDKPKVN